MTSGLKVGRLVLAVALLSGCGTREQVVVEKSNAIDTAYSDLYAASLESSRAEAQAALGAKQSAGVSISSRRNRPARAPRH